jgi:type IV pilus assembly protein PilM
MNSDNLFFRDKTVFGIDIGFSTIKILQVDSSKKARVVGYGVGNFDPTAIVDGVIDDLDSLAKSTKDLFENNLVGSITTNRVAISIPAAKTYSRTVILPRLDDKDLYDAVRLEAEQYIPMPIEQLYINYSLIKRTDKQTELMVVAVPKKIADSYIQLGDILGLEVIALESSIGAASRLFVQAENSNTPTVLIDFGSTTSDITIYDGTVVVTGTVQGGGDSFTQLIASKLKVTHQEALIIKTKYGMGVSKKQSEITNALTPLLEQLEKEIKRMIRYYDERSKSDRPISQLVTMGGGANMPGLSEFMTSHLRLPVRMIDPWQNLSFGHLAKPHSIEKSMYVTAAGLALMKPSEAMS